jgi:hypothetical protein
MTGDIISFWWAASSGISTLIVAAHVANMGRVDPAKACGLQDACPQWHHVVHPGLRHIGEHFVRDIKWELEIVSNNA